FQAEDGIRDRNVTGVQTCALPISALGLGNAVLLKPDPRTSVSGGVIIARILEEAGLPTDVLQLLPGGGDTGAAMVDAPEVRIVSFTGSTAAGRKVGEAASRNLK